MGNLSTQTNSIFRENSTCREKQINDKWQAEIDDIRIITQNRTDAKV